MSAARKRLMVSGRRGVETAIERGFSQSGNCVLPLDRANLNITDTGRVMTTVRDFGPI
jgi:hypothetical protein